MIWVVLALLKLIVMYGMFVSPYSKIHYFLGWGFDCDPNMLVFSAADSTTLHEFSFGTVLLCASDIFFTIFGFPSAALLMMKGLPKRSWTVHFGDLWASMEFLWELLWDTLKLSYKKKITLIFYLSFFGSTNAYVQRKFVRSPYTLYF